eukprot:4237270-Prymnesium_polylepis.1
MADYRDARRTVDIRVVRGALAPARFGEMDCCLKMRVRLRVLTRPVQSDTEHVVQRSLQA